MVTIPSGGVSAEVVVRKYGTSALGYFIGEFPNGDIVAQLVPEEVTEEMADASPEGYSLWRISVTNMGDEFEAILPEDVPSEQLASAAMLLGDPPARYVQVIEAL